MNFHNVDYIGATGLYPIEEIITNTSNALIQNDIYNSNNIMIFTKTELNKKQDNFTPLTPSLVLASDITGNVTVSGTTSAQLGAFSGQIATLEGQVATNTTAITTNTTDIATLNTAVATSTAAIATNSTSILSLGVNKLDKSIINHSGPPFVSPFFVDNLGLGYLF